MLISLVDHTRQYRPPTPSTLTLIAGALQAQAYEFANAHGLNSNIRVQVGSGGYPMVLLDSADVAGALGYHDRDPQGRPYARVFTGTILSNHGTWTTGPDSVSACMSHELCELILDLEANRWAFDGARRLWALEACDAVEMRAYTVAGIAVSDYVLPAYFTPGAPGPYDRMHKLSRPFSIDTGGYSIVERAGSESQVFGTHVVPDRNGRGALVLDREFPVWRHDLKADPASRTMRKLALLQDEVR